MRIALYEPHPDLALLYSYWLSPRSFEVIVTESLDNCAELCRAASYAIALIDLDTVQRAALEQYNWMDGHSVSVPVIGISQLPERWDSAWFVAKGGGLLQKPFPQESLIHAVHAAVAFRDLIGFPL